MHLHSEALFLIQSIILIGLPYAIWRIPLIKKFIPVVVIQIFMGILLGPSVFGQINPEAFKFIFPKESLSIINGLSWMAIILFGFLTGLHFDIEDLKGKGKPFIITGLASIFVPFTLSLGASWWLYSNFPHLAGENATMLTFILALSIAASVTALPVLGAILVEMGLITSKMGKTVLGYATINDGVLWILVSILLTISMGGEGDIIKVVKTIGLTIAYLAFMIMVIHPLLNSFIKRGIWALDPNNSQLVAALVLLLISALATELIGIHYLLGAFIYGALIPKEIAHALYHKEEALVIVILLPFFFMSTGLKTIFDITSPLVWIVFGLISIVSGIGKFFGTSIPAYYLGKFDKATSMKFGVFMQCKGLMEVVVLNMMLQAKVISPLCFSGMVLMAVFTTVITKPLIVLVSKQTK